MHLESILRRLHPVPGFVYVKAEWAGTDVRPAVRVQLAARKGAKGICSGCGKKRPGYDTLEPRLFTFVPFWGWR